LEEINVKYEVLKAVFTLNLSQGPVSITRLRENPILKFKLYMSDDALCRNLKRYTGQSLLKRYGRGGKGDPYHYEGTKKGEARMRYFEKLELTERLKKAKNDLKKREIKKAEEARALPKIQRGVRLETTEEREEESTLDDY